LSRPFEKLRVQGGDQHHAPAVLPSVVPSSTNGSEHWLVSEWFWTFWEKIKRWNMLGFKHRTVHPLAQSLHPLRYAGSIQTPDGPSTSPVITPTTLCRFHSNPGRSIP
jgi:hypothetical protein